MSVQFCGGFFHMTENGETVIDMQWGSFYTLLVHFYYPMKLTIQGRQFITKPNACIIIEQSVPYLYSSVQGEFLHDYICFHLEDDNRLQNSGLPLNEPFYMHNVNLLDDQIGYIVWSLTDVLNDHQTSMQDALDNILRIMTENHILETPKTRRDELLQQRLEALRSEIQANPAAWSVARMAQKVYLSRSHFSVIYTGYFGISPRDDLLQSTMAYAKELLICTTDSISAVSEACGYTSPENFTRAFRRSVGMTPQQFRQTPR